MKSSPVGGSNGAPGSEQRANRPTPPVSAQRPGRTALPAILGGVIAASTLGVGLRLGAQDRAADLALSIQSEAGRLQITRGRQTLLVYAFERGQFKPYVKELCTTRGDNVLRDAPADHRHHHGLMYAVRVNGVNFWEESPAAGRQVPVKLLAHWTGRNAEGLPQASFRQLIHWIAAGDQALADTASAAMLIERRTLTLTVDDAPQETALRWQAEFEVGPAAPKVTLTGSAYNGLGLRLPSAFDHAARHQNSEGIPYSTAQQGDVTPARWSAVSHVMDGHEVMLALFGKPTNQGETRFFTMLNPFAYLSVTQNLEQAPLEYAAGDRFRLDYLLAVYAEKKCAEFLRQRYQRWLRP